MTVQLSVPARNAKLDGLEALIGPSPTLKIFSGAQPASTAAADAGNVLATLALPVDWMAPAANGTKSKSGTWSDPAADATGIAGHYRIYDAQGACHKQGSITATGGNGDMTVDSTNFTAGQGFTVTNMTWTEGNA